MTPLWKIEYGGGSSENGSAEEIEHDLEAATPKEAMLKFLLDQTGLLPDDRNLFEEYSGTTGEGMEEMSIEEIAEHLTKVDGKLDDDRELSFYRGDDVLIRVWYGSVQPEDTIICPRCTGHGRIDPLLKI